MPARRRAFIINYPTVKQKDAAEKIAQQVRAAGRKTNAVPADVSEPDQVAPLIDGSESQRWAVSTFSSTMRASPAPTDVQDISIEEWDRMIAVHLRSVFLVTRLVLPMMYRQNNGKIVNTASQLAYKAWPGVSHYIAAKAAIVTFTRCVALEIGTRNVNANCVAPGATGTALIADIADDLMVEDSRIPIPKDQLRRGRRHRTVLCIPWRPTKRASLPGQCISPNGGDAFL